MGYSEEELRRIYDKTGGYCHLCGKKLAFSNYGARGERGAWHVEHSHALSDGGVDDLRNQRPACTDCNEFKHDRDRASAREEIAEAGDGLLRCSSCGSTNVSTRFLGAHHDWGEEHFYKCNRCGHLGKRYGRHRPEE